MVYHRITNPVSVFKIFQVYPGTPQLGSTVLGDSMRASEDVSTPNPVTWKDFIKTPI